MMPAETTALGKPRADLPGEASSSREQLCVLHVTSARNLSGGARQFVFLAKGMAEAGHRVVVGAPEGSGVAAMAREAGLDTRALSFGSLRGQWKGSRELRAIAGGVRPDVVHSHHTKGHNVALMATFGGRFPPLVVKRGVLYEPKFLWKFKTPRIRAIIANTEAVKQVLVRRGVPAGKVHVVYSSRQVPDLRELAVRAPLLRAELDLGGHGPIVGAVGSGRPEKGLQFVVEAAPQILQRHSNAVFVLVGEGTERFVDRLVELGISERFRILGFRNDVLELMAHFDLLVFPGVDKDSCSNVLLEGMSVGLPIVGSDMVGMDEVIRPGAGTGVLVRAGDPAALAQGVMSVLSDPAGARAMGERARAAIAGGYGIQGRVRETVDVYLRVLRRPEGVGGAGG